MRARSILAFAFVASLLPRLAGAAGAVVGHAGGGGVIAVSGARMAVSLAPGRMTRWLEVSVEANTSGFLWLFPAAPGARVDIASDAWLGALDDATAPTVLPPLGAAPCDTGVTAESLRPRATYPSVASVGSGVAVDANTLAALVTAGGARLTPSETAAFDAVFQAGLDVVVLDYDATTPTAKTHAIQVVEASARSLDTPETGSTSPYVDATVFVMADTRADVGPTPLTLDPATIAWTADGQSIYTLARQQALEAGGGEAWLTESAMGGRLFTPLLAPGALPLPAVLQRYFELTEPREDTGADVDACVEAAAVLGESGAPLASMCPAGQLATAPGPTPCTEAPPGAVSPLPLVCRPGEADAAFALAGLVLDDVWLTRASGLLLPEDAKDVAVVAATGPALSPVLIASGYDFSCIATPDAGLAASGGPEGNGNEPATPPASSNPMPPLSSSSNAAPVVADVAQEAAGAAAGGCSGSSTPDGSDDDESGGCDSSSSSDDSSSGCSGSTDDSDQNCTMHRRGKRSRGATVKMLVFGLAVLAVARRRGGRRAV